MITAAIVAEFNPFHNGHKYLIEEVKSKLNADNIIIIMSGDYVQRGEPALVDKQSRAKMAVNEGADLVLMLPTVYSLSNADLFALSSVTLLDKLRCVDYLCFASECGDISLLNSICDKIYSASYDLNPELKALLSQGFTFAAARSALFPEYKNILDKSNNILALEYIRALRFLNSNIKPFTICRQGNDYNESQIIAGQFASASAIRSQLFSKLAECSLKDQLPPYVYNLLTNEADSSCFINADMFSSELYYSILAGQNALNEYLDINESLANKIINKLPGYESLSSFIEQIKSKELTYSRISRSLMHILLGIKGNSDYYRDNLVNINHIRMLAIRKNSGDLTKEISKKSSIKLVSSVPDCIEDYNDFEKEINRQDLFASTLYDHIVYKEYKKEAIHEYSKKFICL